MKMDNKGQTLVMFIMILPIIILGVSFIFLKVYSSYEKKKQESTINIICDESKKNDDIKKLIELGTKNDKTQDINIKRINDRYEITIEKETFLKIKIKSTTIC